MPNFELYLKGEKSDAISSWIANMMIPVKVYHLFRSKVYHPFRSKVYHFRRKICETYR